MVAPAAKGEAANLPHIGQKRRVRGFEMQGWGGKSRLRLLKKGLCHWEIRALLMVAPEEQCQLVGAKVVMVGKDLPSVMQCRSGLAKVRMMEIAVGEPDG
jgi:hypothetical protein